MTFLKELLECVCDFLGLSKKKEMKQINDNIYIENGEWDQYHRWDRNPYWIKRREIFDLEEDVEHLQKALTKVKDPCWTDKRLYREYDAELESVKKSLILMDGGKCCSDCKCDEGGCGDCGDDCGDGCCGSKEADVVKLPVKEKRKVYHVVSNPKGGWTVKEEKNKNPSARADTKHEAIAKAKELAKKATLGQVIVHKKDGKIQTELYLWKKSN